MPAASASVCSASSSRSCRCRSPHSAPRVGRSQLPDSGVISNTAATNKSHRGRPEHVQEARSHNRLRARLRRPYSGGRDHGVRTTIDSTRPPPGPSGVSRSGGRKTRRSRARALRRRRHGQGAEAVEGRDAPLCRAATYAIPNAAPVSLVDEQFADGRYVLQVAVAAGSLDAAFHLAAKLARKLDQRLRLALTGRLHGKPVKLPPRLDAGPPPGGPDLAAMALTSPTSAAMRRSRIRDTGHRARRRSRRTCGHRACSRRLREPRPGHRVVPDANGATVLGRFEGVGFASVSERGC